MLPQEQVFNNKEDLPQNNKASAIMVCLQKIRTTQEGKKQKTKTN